MLTIRKKFFIFNVVEEWYECYYKWYHVFTMTAFMHVKNKVPQPLFTIKRENYTIENDLTGSEEKIFEVFSKQFRNQIRQAEKDGVNCYFHKDIKGFVVFFNEFAKAKGINQTSVRRMEEMGDELLLSYAELDGKIIAAHSYHYDKKAAVVRTFQSASIRLDNGIEKNLIGKANKLLHFRDMIHFKKIGVQTYDFGGYAGPDDKRDLKGINDFKLNFGGEVITCTNYYTIPYFVVKTAAEKLRLVGKS
jgi:lipid II:glycine glycyltransferase (peptidoglycan interpeptide bridge formation enzyme)